MAGPPMPLPSAPNSPGTGSPSTPMPARVPAPAAQHPQAARVPTGLQYGEAQQLQNAQRAMPVSGQPATPGPTSMGTPGQGAGISPEMLQAAQSYIPPNIGLGGPTQRPGEPVTTGIPTGPGAGPEALAPPRPPDPLASGLAVLNQLGDKVDADTAHLRQVVTAMIGNRLAQ